jgi:hypothetical protein
MNEKDSSNEPEWDIPLSITLTPGGMIHSLFNTASAVHTGWDSCVDPSMVLMDLSTVDDRTGNYCRLVEQEFVEDGQEDVVWHDWAVEVRVGEVLVTGHWQIQVNSSPMDWDWCAREAERAFDKACLLLGRRSRRSVVVDEGDPENLPPKPRTH